MMRFILFTLLICMLLGCKPTTYHCIGFENNINPWTAYSYNQETIFLEKMDTTAPFITKKITINSLGISPNYDVTVKGSFLKAPVRCRSQFECGDKDSANQFSMIYNSEDAVGPSSNSNYNIEPSTIIVDFRLKDFITSFGLQREKIDSTNNNYSNYSYSKVTNYSNKKIGNYIYTDIIEITKDTLLIPSQKYWKVLIAKGYGLIAYYKRFPNEEWVRQ
jgi:hypothetical protein